MNPVNVWLFLFLCSILGATTLEIEIEPKQLQAAPRSQVNIKCFTVNHEAITGCQFRIWYNGKKEHGELINVTESTNISMVNPFNITTNYTAVSEGTDFKNGTCGVKFNNVARGQLLVGCKLTTKSESSAVKTMSLFFTGKEKLELMSDRTKDYNVVAGENVTFDLKTKKGGKKLTKCYFKPNNSSTLVEVSTPNNQSKTVGRYSAWLKGQECRFVISGAEDVDNGALYVIAESGKSTGATVVTIIVKKGPEMQLDKKPNGYSVGDILVANCSMRGLSRTDEVQWTWKLGTETIGDPKSSDPMSKAWSWPWEELTSKVNINLKANDNGRNISCTVGNKSDSKSDFTASTKLTMNITKTTAPTISTSTSTVPTLAGEGKKPAENVTPTSPQYVTSYPGYNATSSEDEPKTEKSSASHDQLSWKLSIEPAEFVTIQRSQSVTVLCKADPGVKLTDCGFQIAPKDGMHYYNASLGLMSEEYKLFGSFSVKYHGTGLDRGQCGIQLTAPNVYQDETFLLGCRARTEYSGWKYNYISVEELSWSQNEINLQSSPNAQFLLPGSNLTMRCDNFFNASVQGCAFTLPDGLELILNKELNTFEHAKHLKYVGEGTNKGHCGIFIPDVSQLNISKNNTLKCDLEKTRTKFLTRQIQINVAEPPADNPTLTISPAEYKNGSELEAKCIAPKSRPPATIKWYLDGQVVSSATKATIREEPVAEWRWRKDAQTTTQLLTMTLSEDDDGKKIRCEISQMALSENKTTSLMITFHKATIPPSPSPPPSTKTQANPPESPSSTDIDGIVSVTGAKPIIDTKEIKAVAAAPAVADSPADSSHVGTIVGVLIGVLLVIGVVSAVAFTFIKRKACFKERESEEKALSPSTVRASQSAPQPRRAPQPQQGQPLRDRRPTPPPDEQELRLMARVDEPEERVEYAVIQRPTDAPPRPPPAPVEEEVAYIELSWDR